MEPFFLFSSTSRNSFKENEDCLSREPTWSKDDILSPRFRDMPSASIYQAVPYRSFAKEGDQHPDGYPDHEPGPTPPLFPSSIRSIGMVVAMVDEIIWDCMPVAGVEFLEQGLGSLLLLVAKLLDETISLNLTKAAHLT